jgi:hypothetical protein
MGWHGAKSKTKTLKRAAAATEVQAADARSGAGYERIGNSQRIALQRIFKTSGEFLSAEAVRQACWL